jgi:hypothetical protein
VLIYEGNCRFCRRSLGGAQVLGASTIVLPYESAPCRSGLDVALLQRPRAATSSRHRR